MSKSDVVQVDYYMGGPYKIHTYGDGSTGKEPMPVSLYNITQLRINLDNCNSALDLHANKLITIDANGNTTSIQKKGTECHATATENSDGFAPEYTYALLDSYSKQLKELEKACGNDAFPPYSIAIWDDSIGSLPSNTWIKCDGSSYTYKNSKGESVTVKTPNLQRRIPIGSGGDIIKGQSDLISGGSGITTGARYYVMKKCTNGTVQTIYETKQYSLSINATKYIHITATRSDTGASITKTDFNGIVWSNIPAGTKITVKYTKDSTAKYNNYTYYTTFNYFQAKDNIMSSWVNQATTMSYEAQSNVYIRGSVSRTDKLVPVTAGNVAACGAYNDDQVFVFEFRVPDNVTKILCSAHKWCWYGDGDTATSGPYKGQKRADWRTSGTTDTGWCHGLNSLTYSLGSDEKSLNGKPKISTPSTPLPLGNNKCKYSDFGAVGLCNAKDYSKVWSRKGNKIIQVVPGKVYRMCVWNHDTYKGRCLHYILWWGDQSSKKNGYNIENATAEIVDNNYIRD